MMSLALLVAPSCKKKGCTDPLANNYSEKAKKDNGSCDYSPTEYTGGDITVNTTFTNKNIKICEDLNVTAGLTIPAGTTIIMCAGTSINVSSTGYIKALGTADKPIIIKGETETKGFWVGIAIKSNNPNNIFSFVTVKDAGTYWAWENANVFVSGSISMDHSIISNSNDVGMYIDNNGSINNFSANTFSNNTTGLNLKATQVSKLDGATVFNDNNINNYIYVRSGTIGTDQTCKKLDTDLLIYELYIDAGLTINAGSRLRMEASGYGIKVNSSGFLNCTGTTTEQIFIGGKYSSAGYWSGIKIASNNPNNIFKYTTVQDGGSYWAYEYSNIYLNGGKLSIDNTSVTLANSYGIYVKSNSQISTSGSVQTTTAGVEANNTITGNGTGANANCTNGCTVFFE